MVQKKKEPVISYKGFNSDWTCRDFKYELGKEYSTKEKIEPCSNGFHACKMPLDIFNYYPPINNDGRLNKFAIVEQDGTIKEDNDKRASSKIKIKTALSIPELFKIEFELIKDTIQKSENTQATTGNEAHSSTTGNEAHSSTTGNEAHSSTTGFKAHSSTTGNEAHSSTTGFKAHSSTTGENSIACALGIESKAKTVDGWLILVNWMQDSNGNWFVKDIFHAKVGSQICDEVIKPDTYYWFENGTLKCEEKE